MGGINNSKRTYGIMEEGSKGLLQNPEAQNTENVKKKQRLDVSNGALVPLAASNTTSDSSTPDGVLSTQVASAANGTSGTASGNHADILVQTVPAQIVAPKTSPAEAFFGLGEAPTLMTLDEEFGVGTYKDFKEVISRVAQETWTGLVEWIDVLSSGRPIEALPGRLETSKASQDFLRRRRLWDYAHAKRAKLIKLLILSQWARNMDEFKQMIDVNRHMARLKLKYIEAATYTGFLRRMMTDLTEKTPNLPLAMDLLAKLKVDDMADLGFLTPPPMKRKEMLNAMRDINSVLTFRLTSYETIPEAFSSYLVRDGRVTFKVEDEFELALSVGSDKHEDQLFFVSFRFCFSPGDEAIRDEGAQHRLDLHVNSILATDGLGACYDFLHDFTLTHKLSILRAQAFKLQKTRWGGHIKYEQVHRAFVLQYWTQRPGPKSWIEIGMRKRPTQNELVNGDVLDTSQLSIRWHRQGKEVRDHDLEIDCAELSLEAILKDVIAADTNFTLAEAEAEFQITDSTQANRSWLATHHESPVEPSECALDVEFSDGKHITLNQEPVTGRFFILPPSGLHSRYEHELNSVFLLAVDIVNRLKQLRAWSSMDRNRIAITMEGWAPFQMPRMSKEIVEQNLGTDVLKYQFYRPQTTWGDNMALCLSHHTSGVDVWRLVEVLPKEQWTGDKKSANALLPVAVNPIRRRIKICNVPNAQDLSKPGRLSQEQLAPHQFLRWVESQATAIVSRDFDNKWLHAQQPPIRRHLVPLSGKTAFRGRRELQLGSLKPFDPVETAKVVVQLDSVAGESLTACYGDRVLSIVDGVDNESGMIYTNSFARLRRALPITGTSLSFEQGSIQIARNDNRMLSIRLRTPTASPSIETLLNRMSGFAHIASCVADLRKMGLEIESFDLTQIIANVRPLIQHAIGTRGATWTDAQLRICFSCNDYGPTGVKFADDGPYKRLSPTFNDFLKQANGKFGPLVKELCAIAPALCCVAEQQLLSDSRITPFLMIHDFRNYKVMWGFRYALLFSYSMERANVDGEACWKLKWGHLDSSHSLNELPEHVGKAKAIWEAMCKRRGKGFIGLHSCLAVQFNDAASVLWEILDAFTPHLQAWQEEEFKKAMADNSDGNSGQIGSTSTANGGARTLSSNTQGGSKQKDKEKERAKDTGASTGSAANRTTKQPAKQQVVVLD